MHKFFISASLLGLLTTSAFAGDTNMYAKVVAGANFEAQQQWGTPPVNGFFQMNTGYDVGASFGYYVAPQISLEGDVLYTNAYYTGFPNSLSSLSLMGNAVWHVNQSGPVKFYLGAGVGTVDIVYTNNGGSPGLNTSQFVLGGQALAGVEVPLSDRLSLLAEYRYQVAANGTLNLGFGPYGYNSHNALMGLQLKF